MDVLLLCVLRLTLPFSSLFVHVLHKQFRRYCVSNLKACPHLKYFETLNLKFESCKFKFESFKYFFATFKI